MTQVAIVIVAFNRPESLKRLLSSILKADYLNYTDIPLVISIDGGGDSEVVEFAESIEWLYGPKKVINHPKNLGLRKHILSCGDLSEKYGSVIVLEDDCLVSKSFYKYSCEALEFFCDDERIAGIGLYAYQYNENAFLPFSPLIDGHDIYFMQHPCSWGQAWTKKQWQTFKAYYYTDPKISSQDRIPENVKNWPESSWKKYFAKYMVEKQKHFVHPTVSYTTNFADIGEHWNNHISFFQVPLEVQENPDLEFVSFDESYNKYDAYFEILPESLICFGADIDTDTCIDLFGSKQKDLMQNKYLLSSKYCDNPIESYGADMSPLLLNILHKNPGNIFAYAIREGFSSTVPSAIRNRILEKQQALGYYFAGKTKYYKLGYYVLHPLRFIKKRIKK